MGWTMADLHALDSIELFILLRLVREGKITKAVL